MQKYSLMCDRLGSQVYSRPAYCASTGFETRMLCFT